MADETPVDRLYHEGVAVIKVLEQSGETSLAIATAENVRKSLLLAASSYFEHRVTLAVIEFVREKAGGSVLVQEFVRNKAIARQFHTWFRWDDSNANKFFGLFGPDFLEFMTARIKSRDKIRSSIKAFLEVGLNRNLLVHQDYASFHLDKTMEEIYLLYRQGLLFVEDLPLTLHECDSGGVRGTGYVTGSPPGPGAAAEEAGSQPQYGQTS